VQFIYKNLCPNDRRDITSARLEKGLVCESCLPEDQLISINNYEDLIKFISRFNKLEGKLGEYYSLQLKLKEFESFTKPIFEELTHAQKSWFVKAIKNESFAITYPTGLGKTTFGILYSLFKIYKSKEANNGVKVFFIVPTRILVQKVSDNFLAFSKKIGIEINIIKSGDKKENILETILKRNFDIAILTPKFLINNKELFLKSDLTGISDLIFVDDVDALVKSSKSIDIVLNLLGFDENIQTKVRMLTKKIVKEDEDERLKILEEVQNYKARRKIGQLIFSSATTRYTSSRIRLLRYLLNFEPGSSLEVFRNVHEFYKLTTDRNLLKETVQLVQELGKGGLLFVSIDKPPTLLKRINKRLNEKNIKCNIVSSKTNVKKILELFEKDEVDVLIGHATFYGPLVRGIDIPSKIKYAIFVGVPKFKFSFKIFERNPLRTLWLASLIVDYVEDFNLRRKILELASKLKNETQKYTPEALRAISYLTEKEGNLKLFNLMKELYEKLIEALSNENLVKKLEEKKRFKVFVENGERYFLIPDSLTYIQASGRTSRLFYGGITTGLSIVLVDDPIVFEGLKYQLSLRSELFRFQEFNEFIKNRKKLLDLINKERIAIEKRDERILKELKKLELKTALFVVESPTKARTISSFFGKPVLRIIKGLRVYECLTDKYILYVTATRGHIFDLAYTHNPAQGYFYGIYKSNWYIPIYSTIKKCRNCGEQFTEYLKGEGICNFCGSNKIDDQARTVEALQELAQECDIAIIATDPDSEGEKIAKDVYLVIRPFIKEIKRAEMHEITFKAFIKAMEDLRDVDEKLVQAQVLRRIGDRWVGFSLSNLMQQELGKRTLGVGRVQTPVLNWIVENYLKVNRNRRIIFQVRYNELRLKITSKVVRIKGWNSAITRKLKEILKNSKITISKVKFKEEEIEPPRPLSTTELLTIAIQRLKTSSDKIMRLAQDLFEAGLITYHRTDSKYISYAGFEVARRYLEEKNLDNLFQKRQYDKEGAHECIRPTRPLDRQGLESAISTGQIRIPINLTPQHYQLYDIIFKTFIASQMPPAKAKVCYIDFKPLIVRMENDLKVIIRLKSVKFITEVNENSFVKVHPIQTYQILKNIVPEQNLDIEEIRILKKGRKLFTEEEIIQMMKKEGIGRPSTYSIIIKKLIEHGYVFKSPNRKVFIPTKTGKDLIAKLKQTHPWIIDTILTREFEETMDKIEKGELNEEDVIRKLDEFFIRFYELKKPVEVQARK